jgi:hypothetical protein
LFYALCVVLFQTKLVILRSFDHDQKHSKGLLAAGALAAVSGSAMADTFRSIPLPLLALFLVVPLPFPPLAFLF